MAIKNPTQWQAPSGTGYFSPSGGGAVTTLSGSGLTTISGSALLTDTEIYTPKSPVVWVKSTKSDTQWVKGYTVVTGTELFITNSLNFIVTNGGNNLVTTTTYETPKNPTVWAGTGA